MSVICLTIVSDCCIPDNVFSRLDKEICLSLIISRSLSLLRYLTCNNAVSSNSFINPLSLVDLVVKSSLLKITFPIMLISLIKNLIRLSISISCSSMSFIFLYINSISLPSAAIRRIRSSSSLEITEVNCAIRVLKRSASWY